MIKFLKLTKQGATTESDLGCQVLNGDVLLVLL